MITINIIKECLEYKSVIKDYDFNHFDNYMFLYEERNKSQCLNDIYHFVKKYNYDETHKSEENELMMIELIKNTNNVSIKCLLMEKLIYEEKYVPDFLILAKNSLHELIDFLAKAATFAPSNRIENLIELYISYSSQEEIKKLLNELFLEIKNRINLMNKYLARVFYKIVKILQEKNLTSKAHYDFVNEIITFALTNKPKDIVELEIYEKVFDFAKEYSKPKKEYSLQLAKYIFSNLDLMHFTIKQSKLEKAVSYLSDNSDDILLINQYKLELDKANKEVLNSLQTHIIPLDEKTTTEFEKYNAMLMKKFESMSSLKLLINLIMSMKIISANEILDQSTNIRKKSFTWDLIPVVLIDPKHGKSIKSDNSSEAAASNMAFSIIMQTSVDPIIIAFLNTFKVDQEVEMFVDEILINNPICRPSKMKTVRNAIIGILNHDFSTHLSNLISTFEDGLRFFFDNSKISTTEFVRGNQSKIDMNDIFRDAPNNLYKNKLLEFLTDDMYNLIQFISVGSNGYNIRNKVMHGDFEDQDYRTTVPIYLSYLIIICYFGFYCNN